MKMVLGVLVVFAWSQIFGATASWTGISVLGWSSESDHPLITTTTLRGGVLADDGGGAMVRGLIFTRTDMDGTHVKAYDYSITAAPVKMQWLLAYCGDVLTESSLSLFADVELTRTYDCGTGGDRIANPSDFYLAFVIEDWDDYISGTENPHIWYGWVNLAVNADGALDVLGSDIAVYGDAMIVGGVAIPEPSGGSLILAGLLVLALRRPRGKGLFVDHDESMDAILLE